MWKLSVLTLQLFCVSEIFPEQKVYSHTHTHCTGHAVQLKENTSRILPAGASLQALFRTHQSLALLSSPRSPSQRPGALSASPRPLPGRRWPRGAGSGGRCAVS